MKIQTTKEMNIEQQNEITKAMKNNLKFIIKDIKIYISNAVRIDLELETIKDIDIIERDNIIRSNYNLLDTLVIDLKDMIKMIKEYLE